MIPLTKGQSDMLAFLKSKHAEGRSPTFREIMEGLGLTSTSAVSQRIIALEERGFIRRLPNRARAIEIVENPTLPHTMPLRRYANSVLAQEARRRGLVLGEIVETFSPSSDQVQRTFREVVAA